MRYRRCQTAGSLNLAAPQAQRSAISNAAIKGTLGVLRWCQVASGIPPANGCTRWPPRRHSVKSWRHVGGRAEASRCGMSMKMLPTYVLLLLAELRGHACRRGTERGQLNPGAPHWNTTGVTSRSSGRTEPRGIRFGGRSTAAGYEGTSTTTDVRIRLLRSTRAAETTLQFRRVAAGRCEALPLGRYTSHPSLGLWPACEISRVVNFRCVAEPVPQNS